MYLNAKEIKNLAEYALGITIEGVDDSELEDFEYFIESDVVVKDYDGSLIIYRRTVRCDGCDYKEVVSIS